MVKIYNKIQNRYTSFEAPVKAAVWFLVCNLLIRALGFLMAPVFTRLLPDVEYGRMSIIMTYEQIVIIISTWEIYLGAFQKGIFKYREEIIEFSKATILLMNVITIIFFGVVFIFEKKIEIYTGIGYDIILLMFAYCIVFPTFNMWIIRERFSYRYKKATAITVINAILSTGMQIVAVIFIGRTAEIKYEAGILTSFCIYLVFYLHQIDCWKLLKRIDLLKKYWSYSIKYQAPLLFHSLSYLILGQADRIMIGRMVGEAQAGYYSVAYSIASIVSIATNSINQSLVPWIYEQIEEKNYQRLRAITNKLLVIIACFLLIVVFVFPEVMTLLFPTNYREAMWCMPPIAVSIFFIFMYSVFVNVETYYEKTVYVSIVSVSCGLLNIALNYVFILKYGYIACGYTTLVSYVMFAVGHYYFMKKVLKSHDVRSKVFDGQILFFISLLLVFLMVIVTLLYRYEWIRYLLICGISLLIIINRDYLGKIINEIKGSSGEYY